MIADSGRDAFYSGEVARDMVDYLRGLGGLHTLDDFAAHEATYVEPISTTYRGHDVLQIPPNGQGIIALIIFLVKRKSYGGPALEERARSLEIEVQGLKSTIEK